MADPLHDGLLRVKGFIADVDPRQIPQPLEILDYIVMVRRLADGGDTEELHQFGFRHQRRAAITSVTITRGLMAFPVEEVARINPCGLTGKL